MRVEEKFYLLVIDEFRAQPQLAEEVYAADLADLIDYGTRFAGIPIDEALERIARREPFGETAGLGFKILHELGPEPEEPDVDLSRFHTEPSRQPEIYSQLCRLALINLLWKNFAAAQEKINQAKFMRDEWAFAHYALGLLRGLDGDLGRAHFELYLAVNREPLLGAKQRIERALSLVR